VLVNNKAQATVGASYLQTSLYTCYILLTYRTYITRYRCGKQCQCAAQQMQSSQLKR